MSEWRNLAAIPYDDEGPTLDALLRVALAFGYEVSCVSVRPQKDGGFLHVRVTGQPTAIRLDIALVANGQPALPPGTNGDTADVEEEPPEQEEQHPCPDCTRTFLSVNALNAHVGSAHRHADKKVACPECGLEFRDNRGVGAHRRAKHGVKGAAHQRPPEKKAQTTPNAKPTSWPQGVPMLACRECDFITAKPIDLAGHTLGAHSRKVTGEERTPLTAAERDERLAPT